MFSFLLLLLAFLSTYCESTVRFLWIIGPGKEGYLKKHKVSIHSLYEILTFVFYLTFGR